MSPTKTKTKKDGSGRTDQNTKRPVDQKTKRNFHIEWEGQTIHLGTFPEMEGGLVRERAKSYIRIWHELECKPTAEEVTQSLELVGVRVVNKELNHQSPVSTERPVSKRDKRDRRASGSVVSVSTDRKRLSKESKRRASIEVSARSEEGRSYLVAPPSPPPVCNSFTGDEKKKSRRLSIDGRRAAHVKWDGKTIALGTFPDKQATEVAMHAKSLTRSWRAMSPKPTVDDVKRSLEAIGIRIVNNRPGRQPKSDKSKGGPATGAGETAGGPSSTAEGSLPILPTSLVQPTMQCYGYSSSSGDDESDLEETCRTLMRHHTNLTEELGETRVLMEHFGMKRARRWDRKRMRCEIGEGSVDGVVSVEGGGGSVIDSGTERNGVGSEQQQKDTSEGSDDKGVRDVESRQQGVWAGPTSRFRQRQREALERSGNNGLHDDCRNVNKIGSEHQEMERSGNDVVRGGCWNLNKVWSEQRQREIPEKLDNHSIHGTGWNMNGMAWGFGHEQRQMQKEMPTISTNEEGLNRSPNRNGSWIKSNVRRMQRRREVIADQGEQLMHIAHAETELQQAGGFEAYSPGVRETITTEELNRNVGQGSQEVTKLPEYERPNLTNGTGNSQQGTEEEGFIRLSSSKLMEMPQATEVPRPNGPELEEMSQLMKRPRPDAVLSEEGRLPEPNGTGSDSVPLQRGPPRPDVVPSTLDGTISPCPSPTVSSQTALGGLVLLSSLANGGGGVDNGRFQTITQQEEQQQMSPRDAVTVDERSSLSQFEEGYQLYLRRKQQLNGH